MKDIKYLKENNVDVDKAVELFGDLQMYNETMNDFLEGVNQKKDKLSYFKANNDLGNYAIFAHSVKSDARYLGFTSVAEVALKHEMAGKEGNGKFIMDDYDNLVNNINEMINIVTKYLTEESDTVSYNASKKKVVVVDDSNLITNLVEKSLKEKYDVMVFSSADDLIIYLDSNVIDILLLDLNMPGKNGFDVLDYLKSKNLFNTINVSIITGDEAEDTIKKAFTYPIVDMLSKPFSVDELNRVVEKTIDR